MDFYPTGFSDLSDREVNELYRADTWSALSRNERLDALQELANRSASELGNAPCEVRLERMEGALYGYYVDGTITINEGLVETGELSSRLPNGTSVSFTPQDTNAQLMDTVHHENFHAFQDDVITGRLEHPNTAQAEEWIANDRNYHSAESPYYRVQSIEATAFDFGEQETMAAFDSMEAEYGTDAGYQEYKSAISRNSYDAAMQRLQELESAQQTTNSYDRERAASNLDGVTAPESVRLSDSESASTDDALAESAVETVELDVVDVLDASDEYAM